MNNDLEHLRLLAIGHYVFSAIMALFACLPLIHVTIGLILLLNPQALSHHGQEEFPAKIVGVMFAVMGSIFVLIGWSFAACMFVAGRSISARKRYTFCFVVAALSCAFFPFGTVLGVFTIMVLSRPSVKEIFQAKVY